MEKHVQFQSSVLLKGTLTIPKGDKVAPAVVIVGGSGPLNRDGNGKRKGQQLHIYNKLAEFLTSIGFVVLRYDKRGTGESEGNYYETGFWDLVEDAKAGIDYVKEQPFVNREKVFLLGHSEGCMLAPAIVQGLPVAGLILVAGTVESLQQAMIHQRQQVSDELKETKGLKGKLLKLLNVERRIKKQGDKLDAKVAASTKDVIRFQGIRFPAKWFREHNQFDSKEAFQQVKCPVLAITGEKDVQVKPEDVFEVKKIVHGDVDAQIIEKMNHMLREQEEDYGILEIKKAYKGVGEKPLSESFLHVLQKWLERHVDEEN